MSTEERLARVEEQVSQVAEATASNTETLESIQDDVHELRVQNEKKNHLRSVTLDAAKIVSGGGVLAVVANGLI